MNNIQNKITIDEFKEILDTSVPLDRESGEVGHLEDHQNIAKRLNYTPYGSDSAMVKASETQCMLIDMANETTEATQEEIQQIFDQLDSLGKFLVFQNTAVSYETAQDVPVGTIISVMMGPRAFLQQIGELGVVFGELFKLKEEIDFFNRYLIPALFEIIEINIDENGDVTPEIELPLYGAAAIEYTPEGSDQYVSRGITGNPLEKETLSLWRNHTARIWIPKNSE